MFLTVHSHAHSSQVAATISIPSTAVTSRLPHEPPYALDLGSYRLKRTLGLVLDRLVGLLWCLVMLAGLNRDLRCVLSFEGRS